MSDTIEQDGIVALTAEIVAAYVSNNAVQQADLGDLIASVHRALAVIGDSSAHKPAEALKPAVPVKKSVFDDYIVCLEDGKKFKSMKRHLGVHYGLSPDEYRAKWGLPKDYPMAAPTYAAARSAMAKSLGLGLKREVPPAALKSAKGRRSAKAQG